MDDPTYTQPDLGEFQKQLSDMVVTYQQLPHGEQPAAFHLLQASLGPLLQPPVDYGEPGDDRPDDPDEPAELAESNALQEAAVAPVAICPAVPEPAPDGDAEQPWIPAADPALQEQAVRPALPEAYATDQADRPTPSLSAKKRRGAERYLCPVATCGRQCGHRKAMVLHVKWEHEQGAVCCRSCRQELTTHAYFLYHKRTCFQGVSALVCADCGARFTMELPYRRHLAGHAINACVKCGERLSSRKALVKHMRHQHKIRECEKWFACDKCPKRFMKKRSWLMHTKVHATKDDVQCGRCEMTVHKHRLLEHEQREHGHEPYSCDTCHKRFRRNQQYLQHRRLHEQYDCGLCGRPFVTQAGYAAHMQSAHNVQPDVAAESLARHRCEVCGATFWAHVQLSQHLEKHPDASLECSRCHTEFESAGHLHRHLRRSLCSRAPQLICDQCGAQFCAHFALRKHLARAHGETGSPERCPHCDFTNPSSTNLRRHIAAHRQLARRYVCDQCAAAFHTLSALKDHQLYMHTSEKQFVCAECQKAFKTSSSLNRHMRIHSDTRPYQCYCGHAYKRMSHLRRHMTAVHNVRTRTRLIARLATDGAPQSAGGADKAADDEEEPPAEAAEPGPYLAGLAAAGDQVTYLADESTLLRVYSVGEDMAEFTLPQGVYSTDTVLLPDGSRSIVLKPAGELDQLDGSDGALGEVRAEVVVPTATLPPPSTIRSHQRML